MEALVLDIGQNNMLLGQDWLMVHNCYNTVRTPTLCKPDTSDRPYYFPFNLLNLATPLTTYTVRLVLLILVPLSLLLCYLYDAVLTVAQKTAPMFAHFGKIGMV
jgi:hypothetical protein